ADTTAVTVFRRCTTARPARTAAPRPAAQAGFTDASDVSTKPMRVSATTTRVKRGHGWGVTRTAESGDVRRSALQKRRKTTYSVAIAASHGAVISPAKRVNVNPLADRASRLVRL